MLHTQVPFPESVNPTFKPGATTNTPFLSEEEQQLEELEIGLILEAVHKRYGYDYRQYTQSTIRRRLHHHRERLKCKHLIDMLPRLLRDEESFSNLALDLSITVTEMFRDPWVYKSLREKVIPFLKTFPTVRIWHAGCATGEEVHSLAIILKEEGLLDRCVIYATDINPVALNVAKHGLFPIERVKEYTANYQKTGGLEPFAEYYRTDGTNVILDRNIRNRISFFQHNLCTDSVFGEMQLILCRNVMIYFNQDLQNRVFKLFRDSLAYGGFLCIGSKEDIRFSEVEDDFEAFDSPSKIYKMRRLAY